MKARIEVPMKVPVRRDSLPALTIFSFENCGEKYISITEEALRRGGGHQPKHTPGSLLCTSEYLCITMTGVIGCSTGDSMVYVHGQLVLEDDKLPKQD